MRRAWYLNIDWTTIAAWAALVVIGLVGIYSATSGPAAEFLLATVQQNFGRQFSWLIVAVIAFGVVMFVPVRVMERLAYPLYGIAILLLILTLFFGREINGAKAWLYFGPFGLQVGEVAKVASLLAVARFVSDMRGQFHRLRPMLLMSVFMVVPAIIIILQNDTGTALPYLAALPFILFFAGAPLSLMALLLATPIAGYLAVVEYDDPAPYYVLIFAGVFVPAMFIATKDKLYTLAAFLATTVFGTAVWVGLTRVLLPHQVSRIIAFTNPEAFADTSGYHVIQSKLAIGQGGLIGKGFLEGTQTQMAFIPEQSTDFIFTVIGEEFGFIGAALVLLLFGYLLIRMAVIGSQSGHTFPKVFAAGVCGIFLTHILINVGMTTGVVPVIGIPLPLVSYGGSALLTNSTLVALVVAMYARREEFSIYRG